jgi:hypothetical protein
VVLDELELLVELELVVVDDDVNGYIGSHFDVVAFHPIVTPFFTLVISTSNRLPTLDKVLLIMSKFLSRI